MFVNENSYGPNQDEVTPVRFAAKTIYYEERGLVSLPRRYVYRSSETYGVSDFAKGDLDKVFRVLPFIFGLPMPNLSNASLTSLGAPGILFFCLVVAEATLLGPALRTLREWWMELRFSGTGRSKVFTDDGRGATRAGFDMLLRPSSASRSSVTPTPRLNLPRLWRERLSMFIKVGVTRRRE